MLNQSQVDYVNKSLDMLQAFPVIVICSACDSGNVITNPSCVQCGFPLGQVVEDKINNYERKTKKKSYILETSPSSYAISDFPIYASRSTSPSRSAESPSMSEPPYSYSISPSESEPLDFWGEEVYEEKDLTPVYRKCANCWTLNNIREHSTCPACGAPASIEEIVIDK